MEANKKVLIFSHELPPQGGGAGVVGLQYCNELSKAGFDVTLLTKKELEYPSTLSNVEVIGTHYISKAYLLPYYLKLRCMDLSVYDYIILNDMVSVYVAGFCFSLDELGKSILVLHGSEPEIIYQSPDIYQKIFCLPYYYNRAVEGVRKIIAVSDYMKKKFLNETTFNDIDKIEVRYSKLGTTFFPITVSSLPVKKTEDKDIILTVSRIEKGKGFIDMYIVFKKLISLDPKFTWVIVGDGSFKEAFEGMVQTDEMEDNIKFIGKVHRNDLKGYFESADIFWLLSNYKESFGLVYLEAQSCLCPVIGYNKYGVTEAISDNKTGFLVDKKEECLDIFLQRKYRALNKSDFYLFVSSFHSSPLKTIF